MSEDLFVDVEYRGLALGERLRIEDFVASQAYLHHPAPMPVGSRLLLNSEGVEIQVQVARVSEQVAGAEKPSGMFVAPLEMSSDADAWWETRVARHKAAEELASESEKAAESEPEAATKDDEDEADLKDTQVMDAVKPEALVAADDNADTQVMDAVTPDEVKKAETADPKPAKAKKKRRRKKR